MILAKVMLALAKIINYNSFLVQAIVDTVVNYNCNTFIVQTTTRVNFEELIKQFTQDTRSMKRIDLYDFNTGLFLTRAFSEIPCILKVQTPQIMGMYTAVNSLFVFARKLQPILLSKI
jgi:hypothetical protein